ncbi:MAG: hypothetical protein HGB26_07460 [Desulfobulbaceae bacterium]|nr:hypothetical protein [Desulfobulbaceae bacterium]
MNKLPTRIIALIIFILALFALSSGVLLVRQMQRSVQVAQPTSSAETAVATPVADPSSLPLTSTVPWYIDLPPTDRAMEETKEALHQEVVQTVTVMAEQGITPPPLPTLDFSGPGVFPITEGRHPAGAGDIIETSAQPWFRKSFIVTNYWTAPIEGFQVVAYAGYDRDSPQQGAIYVQWGEPGAPHPTRENGYYPAPEGIGSLHVVDAVDTVLVLSSEEGATVQFDVISASYNPRTATATFGPTRTSEPYPAPSTPIPAATTTLFAGAF